MNTNEMKARLESDAPGAWAVKTQNDKPVTVTVQISAEDYADLVAHFAKNEEDRMGRPLVAVSKVFGSNGDVSAWGVHCWERDIARARGSEEEYDAWFKAQAR